MGYYCIRNKGVKEISILNCIGAEDGIHSRVFKKQN